MMNSPINCPDWMLKNPSTKAEYDRYMQIRIDIGNGFIPVYDVGFTLDRPTERYHQLTETSAKIWQLATEPIAFWMPIDPRWSHDQNRSPYRYRDEYRGEPETWGPVPWDAFQA